VSPSGSRPSPTVEGGYPLAGVSNLPDPAFHAFRQDLADVALADRVIASHYAEPLLRHLVAGATLYAAAADDAEVLGQLQAGDELWLLDDTRGWAWGYGGPERRVGYVRAEAVGL
jgi:Bacterial dipeptidyl-peptidase Sh3 domain